MPSLSRRTLVAGSAALAGLGASGLGAGFSAPARAQAPNPAPAAGRQVPSAYRYKVGDVEITAIADGMRTFPLPPTFVRNQPPETVKAALKAAFLDEAQLSIPFNVLLLNIGGRRVLIDTGNGGEPGAVGQLRGTLGTLGVQPEMIDQIVISHFHGDHINGLVLADGTPAFPKAQVMVPEAEWAFWMDEGQMSRAPDAMKPSFQNVRRVFKPFEGKLERYAWDKEVAPGLKAVGTPGHTPGHTSFALESNLEEMFIQSDLTNIAALFVANPSWQVQFDMDAAKAAEVRKANLDRVAADRTRLAGYHFPFPAVAHVEKAGDGFRYVPVLWNPSSL
ncbi:MBL fold metallo-hydrolase [Xanthobacter tagetidis]|uniref:MBL fold metallo-hydrolase n=1 Tax=Xanthobacter tagetidis TaxID=60216 RepID=A0A3L7AGZ4_9HYPH|nr:MBL fold metallo-hydrolase [Xanthobacter tagetidis]MBB6306656.1 glyoxylase-like metal-dependent hydrolase (beta-lactamase superfamily II) [Xanthobacter tagetidis]RLP79030.1 MBL fold metallo-hydrolase [Xanthobacter tagetidis]